MSEYAMNPFDHLAPHDGLYPTVAMPHPFNRQPVFSTMGRGPRGEKGDPGAAGEIGGSYRSVAYMVQDSSLEKGLFVHTAGFHAAGDGGAAWYEITDDGVANGMDVIELNNGLLAKLVVEDYVTPEMFGACGDGDTDDSNAITKALTYNNVNLGNKTYLISSTLNVLSNQIINGNGCKIKASTPFNMVNITDVDNLKIYNVNFESVIYDAVTDNDYYIVFSSSVTSGFTNFSNIDFVACTFNGNTSSVLLTSGNGVLFEGCKFKNATTLSSLTGGGYNILLQSCKDVFINNCTFVNNPLGRHGIYISIDGNKTSDKSCENINIHNCLFDDSAKTGVATTAPIHNRGGKYATVKDCVFIKPSSFPITITEESVIDYNIEGCRFIDSIVRPEATNLFAFSVNGQHATNIASGSLIDCYIEQSTNVRPYAFEISGANTTWYVRDIYINASNSACAFSCNAGAILDLDSVVINASGYWLNLNAPNKATRIGPNIVRKSGGGALFRAPVSTPMALVFDEKWLVFTQSNTYGYTNAAGCGLSITGEATGNDVVITLSGNTSTLVPLVIPYAQNINVGIAPAATPTLKFSSATGALVIIKGV